MIAQIIRKRFFTCNRCVCVTMYTAIRNIIPRQLMCVIGAFRKYLMKAPELHKRIPARTPCVTDVLCNWVPRVR